MLRAKIRKNERRRLIGSSAYATGGRGGNDGGSNPLATSPRSSGVALAATSDWNLRLVLLEGGRLCGGRRVFGCCLLWLLSRSL